MWKNVIVFDDENLHILKTVRPGRLSKSDLQDLQTKSCEVFVQGLMKEVCAECTRNILQFEFQIEQLL